MDEDGAYSDERLWQEAPCGLLVAASDGLVLRANRTFCRWLGYESADLIGTTRFQQLMPMGARVFLQTHWAPLMQMQGSVGEIQFDLLHRDGRRVPMMLSAVRRHYGDEVRDEIAALVATDRKLYERELLSARAKAEAAMAKLAAADARLREVNDELSAADRRKDAFLATLAHELRNPLAPMANALEVLKLSRSDANRTEWAASVLSRQIAQMVHLVDDLLDASRIGEGKVTLRLERLALADLLGRVAEEALPAIEAAGQSLIVDFAREPMLLNADETRIIQVVANLLNNARKYSPIGARVELRAWPEAGHAVIEVSDSGIGIAADELGRIFNMFSQLGSGLDRAQGGLGIGLALVKGLVELHGGAVAARSEGPGKGSSFTVRIPLDQLARGPLEPNTAVLPNALAVVDGIRLLIVDDNVDAAETLAMTFDMLGYQVRIANNAAQALAEISSRRPDIALLDIGLPDMTGYELAQHLRRQPKGSELLLVAVTGWGQASDKRASSEAGFDHHFTKPIDFRSLHDAMIGAVSPRKL